NALLFSLHRVAQALPASLDMVDVLRSTITRLHDLIGFSSAAILLKDDVAGGWVVAAAEGQRAADDVLSDAQLPGPLRRAMAAPGGVCVPQLHDGHDRGLDPAASSGLYGPLRARGALVGLVALEDPPTSRYGPRDLELFDGLAEPAALAIDNARWFGRLRTVGADEERTRIARDLHDRIGQSLAYLAFELDRIARRTEAEPLHGQLHALRQDVRRVVGEVRETLYDLRTDVSDEQDLVSTLELFLDRVRQRAGVDVHFEHEATGRLALPQERELSLIGQEAVTNVERHGQAGRLDVGWWGRGVSAALSLRDDGRGLPPGSAMRADAYGMLGMRERADAIGAQLEIDSGGGTGTTVRCLLETA